MRNIAGGTVERLRRTSRDLTRAMEERLQESQQLGLYFGLYTLQAFAQEFIARGVFQGALARFMSDRHFLVPIGLSAMMFALSHLRFSPSGALLTVVLGFALGLVYHRHGNLFGVTAMHYAVGVAAMAYGLV